MRMWRLPVRPPQTRRTKPKTEKVGGRRSSPKGQVRQRFTLIWGFTVTQGTHAHPPPPFTHTPEWCFCLTNQILRQPWQYLNHDTLLISLHRYYASVPSDSTRMNFHWSCDTGFASGWKRGVGGGGWGGGC